MREDDDDKEPEQRGEKQQHQGANEEISSDIYHSEVLSMGDNYQAFLRESAEAEWPTSTSGVLFP